MIHFSKINLHKFLLFDALGAFTSFLTNGLLLPYFSSFLGIEAWIFRTLAGIALSFMVYDLILILIVKNNIRPWMLKFLIILNLSYCIVTCSLLFLLPNISTLGIAVVLMEILVILLVVGFERKVFQQFIN